MNNLLQRLDFEHSKSVQREIVKLLFRPFIPKHIDGIDYVERFKRVFLMCKVSRQASLNFHHLIYPQKLIGIEIAGLSSLFFNTASVFSSSYSQSITWCKNYL